MSNEEQKIAELENDPVSKLLGGLKRVEAPGDFDFRVKARIASGRPVNRPTSWLPASVRLAVPLGLLLAVGAYFGLDALYSPNQLAVAPIVEIPSVAPEPINDIRPTEVVSVPAAPNVIARNVENKPAVREDQTLASRNEKRIVRAEPTIRKPGSTDIALGIGRTIEPKSVSVKRALLSIGIDASYSAQSWKVSSVNQNSKGDISGLKTGDVIEAIDGQNLTETTSFGPKFSGRTIRVRRDGQTVQINLKP